MRYCTKCGTPVQDPTDKFCPKCGAALPLLEEAMSADAATSTPAPSVVDLFEENTTVSNEAAAVPSAAETAPVAATTDASELFSLLAEERPLSKQEVGQETVIFTPHHSTSQTPPAASSPEPVMPAFTPEEIPPQTLADFTAIPIEDASEVASVLPSAENVPAPTTELFSLDEMPSSTVQDNVPPIEDIAPLEQPLFAQATEQAAPEAVDAAPKAASIFSLIMEEDEIAPSQEVTASDGPDLFSTAPIPTFTQPEATTPVAPAPSLFEAQAPVQQAPAIHQPVVAPQPQHPIPQNAPAPAPSVAAPAPHQQQSAAPAKKASKTATQVPRKGNAGLRVIAILLLTILLAFVVLIGSLYFFNRPGKAINAFAEAARSGDVSAIQDAVRTESGFIPSEADWAHFATSLQDSNTLSSIITELENQSKGIQPGDYNAFRLREQNLFLFAKSYSIVISPVQVKVNGAPNGSKLNLDGNDLTGNPSDNGILYTGIMPGSYTVMVTGKDGEPLLDVPQKENLFAALLPTEITLDSAVAPDTSAPTPAGPIDPITDPAGFAAAATQAQIDHAIVDFYSSYLDCINQNSITPLRSYTDTSRAEVEKRIAYEENKKNTFAFVSAVSSFSSVSTGELNGLPMVTVNATFNYTYVPREGGESKPGSNNQTYQLVYQDGSWKVHQFAFVSDEDFAANKTTDMSAA